MNKITVCALFYGDFPAHAKRLLESIGGDRCNPEVVEEFRIGLNEVSAETLRLVEAFVQRSPVPVRVYVPEKNVGKYPLMRRMFFDERSPIRTPRVMWWDDDSYLEAKDANRWWQDVAALKDTLIGQCWFRPFVGSQQAAIEAQKWFTGTPWYSRRKDGKPWFRFATGGWWIIDFEFVKKWNYPFPELHHNGGDAILSELVRQQGNKFLPYDKGVKVNWGLTGRISPRRGLGQGKTERLLWKDWTPDSAPDNSVHEFKCKTYVSTPHDKDKDA